jgi:proline iminopeptidase
MNATITMRALYPERKIFATHRLKVSDIHELHIEESGNPNGKPVLFNHGGPGAGIFKDHARQFDPDFFRIIQFDQRGAGKSTPYADIRENTTAHLIDDIEKIRAYLGVESWIVGGRSWGTTLSLLYAQAHPKRVKALFLAAVFLAGKQETDWLLQEGAGHVYPEQWAKFIALVPREKRNQIMKAYGDLLFGKDQAIASQAARSWSVWEAHTCSVLPDAHLYEHFGEDSVALALARFEYHYLSQGAFIEEGQIVRDAHLIAHIPTKIIHGRYDMNCTFDNAVLLKQALPNAELIEVPLGGHAANDADTIDKQVRAADALKDIYKSAR